MISSIRHTLPVFILIGFLIFASEKTCAQTAKNATETQAADEITTRSDGTAYVSGVTPGRAKSILTGLLGLVSLAISWRAKARSAKTGAKVALALGLVVVVLSIIHLVTTAGAVFGSGSGKAGTIIALLLGLASIILSVITIRSSRIE
ncbi:MAG TPA: DUF6223 family protein [Pedobacter sp.]|uniref:DUF6223 family protein n=1 Tax=Pedobacter sp. TaxID=1411316 RepID=UPI002BFF3B9B|nr:DUF6223 family protein [Pedobacter sp.]HMI01135.1 DUF6223 family protein [Pedobacter sp.]